MLQEDKHLELSLVRLFYNERDIDEVMEDINHKNHALQKEVKKKDKIEDEIKDKKKEQGKLQRELTKVEATIKESVSINKAVICYFFEVLNKFALSFVVILMYIDFIYFLPMLRFPKTICELTFITVIFSGGGIEQEATTLHQSQRKNGSYD